MTKTRDGCTFTRIKLQGDHCLVQHSSAVLLSRSSSRMEDALDSGLSTTGRDGFESDMVSTKHFNVIGRDPKLSSPKRKAEV